MDLKIVVNTSVEYATLCVTGELDVYTAPQLRQALMTLLSEGQTRIIVDLSSVNFIDSTGIGVLVGALRRVRDLAGELVVTGARPGIRRVFDITGLTNAFDRICEFAGQDCR